jgi:hypothetical protein
MYDLFFISEEKTQEWFNLKSLYPTAKHSKTILDASKKSFTSHFWCVFSDLDLDKTFDFSFIPDNWSKDYIHVFRNKNYFDGVCLIPKNNLPSEKEANFRFFTNKKEVDINASTPKKYEIFYINTYEDYLNAAENCLTTFFWAVPDDISINFNFDYQAAHWEKYPHVFKNNSYYDGLMLFPKDKLVTEKEFNYRFFIKKKEVDLMLSTPKPYDKFFIDSYEEYLNANKTSKSNFFWVIPSTVELHKDFDFNYQAAYWEKFPHVFLNGSYFDGVTLHNKDNIVSKKEFEFKFFVKRKEIDIVASFPKKYDYFDVSNYNDYLKATEEAKTNFFWFVPEDVSTSFNFEYQAAEWEKYTHVFLNNQFYDGICLFNKDEKVSKKEFDHRFFMKKKEVDINASDPRRFDIVFISYNEPNADYNYKQLLKIAPKAKRIQNVKGIHKAHIEAAKLVKTEMFWIVDGDALMQENFKFEYQVPRWDQDVVHVWRSKNPVNNLSYGYGGVKLLPTKLTLNMSQDNLDMTTSISNKFKTVDEISNKTMFNTSSFSAWKSGFRECVKLASGIIKKSCEEETQERLDTWCNVGVNIKFGIDTIRGAVDGREYGIKNKDDKIALEKINDFNWLYRRFSKNPIR